MTGSELCDDDVLLWSERQAALLRRVAAGARENEPAPDWPSIIEEIESVGRSELHAVESPAGPGTCARPEGGGLAGVPRTPPLAGRARGFRRQARRQFTPCMRQRIDLVELYADALDRLPTGIDGQPPLRVPNECRLTLDEQLAGPLAAEAVRDGGSTGSAGL